MTQPVGAVWAMKNGDYQPVNYASTQNGIQSALNYVAAPSVTAPGGVVFVGPSSITITSPLSIGGNTQLKGAGRYTTFIQAGATFAGSAMVTNADQVGGMQWCSIENMTLDGNKASATVSYGIFFKGIGQPGYIKDISVNACSGIGIWVEGISTNAGNFLVENTGVANCPLGSFVVSGYTGGYSLRDINAEFVNAGVAAVLINGPTVSFYPACILIDGCHIEGLLAGSIGIHVKSSRNVHIKDVIYFGSGSTGDLVKITGTTAEVQNVIVENLTASAASVANAIVDSPYNYTMANGANGVNLMRYDAGTTIHSGTLVFRRASDQASGTTLTPNAGNVLHVTGGTTIDNIVTNTEEMGRMIIIWFAAATKVRCHATSGGNIYINGDFQAAAEDMLTLVSTGTNWIEVARTAVNYGRGTDIASAATISIPTDGTVFHVTGAVNVTNGITVNTWDNGRTVHLIFDSTPTVTDTGTSVLAGNFVATANDVLTITCDGTNWYEVSRSAN